MGEKAVVLLNLAIALGGMIFVVSYLHARGHLLPCDWKLTDIISSGEYRTACSKTVKVIILHENSEPTEWANPW